MTNKWRIFQVETEFIVATDAASALSYYVELVGEEMEVPEATEIPEDKWDTMEIVDIDEPGHPKQTFRAAFDEMMTWENQEYPKILATTEY